MRLSQVVADLDLTVQRDGDFDTLGFVTHDRTRMLVFIESSKLLQTLDARDNISCVVCTPELSAQVPARMGVCTSSTPRGSFYRLHNRLVTESDFYWTGFATRIAKSAVVHPTAHVASRDVVIGEGVVIDPRAVILPRVTLEDSVTIRAGAVIGSEGFQAFVEDGALFKVLHGGGVRIRKGSEVQSNTCVDSAVFGGFTEIGEECLIDNLVHVAHNVRMGPRCRLAAHAMIGGSVTLGTEVWVGPSAAISSEINVGDRAFITLGAVVTRDVGPGEHVSGNFAIGHEKFLAFLRSIR